MAQAIRHNVVKMVKIVARNGLVYLQQELRAADPVPICISQKPRGI